MNINHIVGDGPTNLYVVLVHDNWALDEPEGLAHWDGEKWTWKTIFQNHWTRAAMFQEGRALLLDVEGTITTYSPTGDLRA